jgi:hypothetical protein
MQARRLPHRLPLRYKRRKQHSVWFVSDLTHVILSLESPCIVWSPLITSCSCSACALLARQQTCLPNSRRRAHAHIPFTHFTPGDEGDGFHTWVVWRRFSQFYELQQVSGSVGVMSSKLVSRTRYCNARTIFLFEGMVGEGAGREGLPRSFLFWEDIGQAVCGVGLRL